MNKNRIYLWSTIYQRLLDKAIPSYDIDIRYLQRWISLYPCCFPEFMISGFFTAVFNAELYRWEIYKGHHEVKFNPKNYI